VSVSGLPVSLVAYWAVLIGVFVTAFYSFRMFFLVFHGAPRMDKETESHVHESPWVVTVPLIALAVPSVLAGMYWVGPMLFGDFFAGSIFVLPQHDVLGQLGEAYTGVWGFIVHGVMVPPLWFALAGVAAAWYIYLKRPDIADNTARRFGWLHRVMLNKYGFDDFNQKVIAAGSLKLGRGLFRGGDQAVIDSWIINGTANAVGRLAARVRHIQTGFLYHYAFAMIIGLVALVGWVYLR
jgi:NADH-quinone oxidoreductase subunit L